ncbi:MAG: acyl carrier protein [Bacteroidales bacterium]|nr:acyl carrier protein [Candidatus Colimorpha pelethequi]
MKYLSEIKEIVAGILQIPVEQLDVNANMNDVENWDSLRNLVILSTLEEHFEIQFPDDDIFDLTNVQALADEIEKLK